MRKRERKKNYAANGHHCIAKIDEFLVLLLLLFFYDSALKSALSVVEFAV